MSKSEDQDKAVFEELWADWDMRALLHGDKGTLKTLAELWFTRGIRQGVKWAGQTNERVLNEKGMKSDG